jgi:nucleoside-diphosphate-sugar epimerase
MNTSSSSRNILVVGAGYTGAPLALALKQRGHRVTAWVRSEESARRLQSQGLLVKMADASQAQPWREIDSFTDAVVFCAAAGGGGEESWVKVYREALGRALDHAAGGTFVYTSSTSVFQQNDGSAVDESSPILPLNEKAELLVAAEERVLAAWGVVLRLSGIYGPGRAVYWSHYVQKGAPVPGNGERWVNMIHRDDAVAAILHVLEHPATAGQAYNTTDNEPVQLRVLLEWIAARAGRPRPVFGAPEDPARRRGLTSKRVLNHKLRALGWAPTFPTYREGYAALLAEMNQTAPEAR